MVWNLRKKLQLIMTLLLVGAAIFGVIFFNALGDYRSAVAKEDVAETIVRMVLERRLFADDYLLYGTDRARTQWYSQQERIESVLSETYHGSEGSVEYEIIDKIRSGMQGSRSLFDAITRTHGGDGTHSVADEQQSRFRAELTFKAEETVHAARDLSVLNNSLATEALKRAVTIFSVAVLTYLSFLAACFFIIWRSANQLAEGKKNQDTILSSIGDAVFAIDTSGFIRLFNRAAVALSGYTEAEALQKHYGEVLRFVDERTGVPSTGFIDDALRGTTSHMHNATALCTKAGALVPVADTAAPIFGDNGSVSGVVVVFRDVSSEREIDRQKDEFISVASHQLRTPLGSARANLEAMEDEIGALSTKSKTYFKEAYTGTVRAIGIVAELLNVTRIEQKRVKDEPILTDIAAVIKSAIAEMRPEGKKRHVRLSFENAAEGARETFIDAKRFREVVQNLLSNAVRYTRKDGDVLVRMSEADGGLDVEVRDTGMGIPLKDRPHIFTKFYRAENARRVDMDGTGLGLYIVKAYVEGWGGSVRFESEIDKGTSFFIRIPIKSKPL